MIMLSSQVLLTLHLVRDLKNKLAISILGFIILPEQNTRKKGNFSEWHYKLVMLLGLCGSLVKIQKKKKKKEIKAIVTCGIVILRNLAQGALTPIVGGKRKGWMPRDRKKLFMQKIFLRKCVI